MRSPADEQLPGGFPATRGSILVAAADRDPAVRREGLERLVASYWKPVYKYLRVRWRAAPEDAEDLAQEFFARAHERDTFAGYDPERARFRTFLRVCLDRFVANERKAARRVKRGGDLVLVPLDADFAGAEGELARQPMVDLADPADPGQAMEEYFHREWARSLFGLAVEDLRRESEAAGKGVRFALFERYDLEERESDGSRLTYAELGAPFGLNAVQVTNQLAAARRDLRRLVLARLREACGSEAEFRAEARSLLGADPP